MIRIDAVGSWQNSTKFNDESSTPAGNSLNEH
jgi:hypothetical protein